MMLASGLYARVVDLFHSRKMNGICNEVTGYFLLLWCVSSYVYDHVTDDVNF